ncbi:MAG: CPBP family intramembrane metalloprotease [Verrucomicrobia bacterium]|nr:CPBP family intramembrane metalloprotease [Verrucomicrobiota bacterium]
MKIINLVDRAVNPKEYSNESWPSLRGVVDDHLLIPGVAGVVGGSADYVIGTSVEVLSKRIGFEWIDKEREEWLLELTAKDWWGESISSPVFEELEYRLFWQTGLTLAAMLVLNKFKADKKINLFNLGQVKLSMLVGLIAASIIFAQAHYSDTAQNPYVLVFECFLAGLVYGGLYIRYGLVACCVAHIVQNKWCDVFGNV